MNTAVLTNQRTVTDLLPMLPMCMIKISLQMCIMETFLTLWTKINI